MRELEKVISDINDEQPSSATKRAIILSLLKEQVRVREKLLHERCNIKFSINWKQRPLTEISRRFATLFQSMMVLLQQLNVFNQMIPCPLLGKKVSHKFMDESDNEEWYISFVVVYNSAKQLHEIAYENENDRHFNLMEDLKAGDLKICLS